MIYLIDDTPIQMLKGYFDPATFEDCFRRIDSLPLEDVSSLAGASCVLMHSSYNNAFVRRRVLDVLDYGDVVPVVLFSDGDNEEADHPAYSHGHNEGLPHSPPGFLHPASRHQSYPCRR